MILRHLVSHFIRKTAEQKFREHMAGSQQRGDEGAARAEESPQPAQPPEVKPCDIAFVFALGVESGGFVDLLSEVVSTRCASYTEHTGKHKDRAIVVADSEISGRLRGGTPWRHGGDDTLLMAMVGCDRAMPRSFTG